MRSSTSQIRVGTHKNTENEFDEIDAPGIWRMMRLLLIATTVTLGVAFQVSPPATRATSRTRLGAAVDSYEDGRIWEDEWDNGTLYDRSLDEGSRSAQAPNLSGKRQVKVATLGWDWWDQPLDRERDPPSVWQRWKEIENGQVPQQEPTQTHDAAFRIQ